MKRIELLFSAILVPVDYVMLATAGLLAYQLRFGGAVTGIRPILYALPLGEYASALALVALGFLFIFALSGLYAVRATRRFLDEVTNIFLACSTGIMALIVLFFFQREFFSSRFIIMSGWVLAVLSVTLGRLIVRSIQRSLLSRHVGAYRVLLVGRNGSAEHLAALMEAQPRLGYTIAGRLSEADPLTLRSLGERLRSEPLDVVFQADPTLPKEQTQLLMDFANDHHIGFRYVADLLEAQATNIAVETLGGIPVIEIRRTRLDGWGRIWKRAVDIIVAATGLLVLLPCFLIIAFIIRLDSNGPVLVRLKRIGQSGRPFSVYKFRSMVRDAEALKATLLQYNERSGPLFKMKNDPRITKAGAWLRKTSIDELPQLINVLKGEMSLVGPRPHEPGEVAQYERHHRQLMAIRPGMTGLAQISGRSDLDFDEEARLDIFYIENWSLLRDLGILLKTPLVVLRMRSAA